MNFSYWGPILFPGSPCLLHSPVTVGGDNICWITVWGALIHIWRPDIADGCDISCLLIWQEIFSFHIILPDECACILGPQSCPTLWSRGLKPTELLCPWDFPGKSTGVGCHFLLRIFPTQESNSCLLCLLHWQTDSLPLSHLGSPLKEPVISVAVIITFYFLYLLILLERVMLHMLNTYMPLFKKLLS